jgi:cobalt/nickel transport protein
MKNSSKFFLGIFLVSLLVAGVASNYASSNPDGLEKVAQDIGFGESATEAVNADSLLADYGVKGIDNSRLSTGAAGVIGVIATGAIATGFFFLIRRKAGEQK